MEHGGDADLAAQMRGIGGSGQHRLRRHLDGQCEDDMEVADREQVGLVLGETAARGGTLIGAAGGVMVIAQLLG